MKITILILFLLNIGFAFIPENHIYIRMFNSFAAGVCFMNLISMLINEYFEWVKWKPIN
jgi:hypothetical protein